MRALSKRNELTAMAPPTNNSKESELVVSAAMYADCPPDEAAVDEASQMPVFTQPQELDWRTQLQLELRTKLADMT